MLKQSEFFKSVKVRVLLCVEVILVLVGIVGLFGKTGVVIERDDTQQFIEEGVTLPAGVYTLRLYYAAEEELPGYFSLESDNPPFKALLANPVTLVGGMRKMNCQFYLLGKAEHLKLQLNVSENVRILGAEVIAGTGGSRIYLFWLFSIFIPLDLLILLSMYHRKNPLPTEKLVVIFGIPILVLFASLPVMIDYVVDGDDLIFHLQRIEAMANSFQQGEIFSRMESFWLNGHGYASALFYGNTFLTIPALLRILGFPPGDAYKIFLVLINLATAIAAYVSFSGCLRNRYIGAFGCALYTLSPYRLYNMYQRAAVGETLAMVFLPLLIWGFYRIYTEDVLKKGYLWSWVLPVIGFSGLIQSHLLSCEMTGIFVVLLCLILWKKTFRPHTFYVLCLTVIMTIVINAWFLVPLFDLMSADQYCLMENTGRLIQDRGIYPAQIFYTLQAAGNSAYFSENGMTGAVPVGLGAALLICLLLWLMIRNMHGKENLSADLKSAKTAGDISILLAAVALFMSTRYFPYDFLTSVNTMLASLIGTLQFPTRLTSVATVFAVFAACVMGKWALRENRWFLSGKVLLSLVTLVAVLFGAYQLNDILLSREGMLRLYTAQNMGTKALVGAEYLPLGVEMDHFATYHDPALSEGAVLESYEKDGLEVNAGVLTDAAAWVEFPMLYYKGYRVKNCVTGEQLAVHKGNNGDVRVDLPENFSGNIRVWYAGMWYWHLAEGISVLAGTGFLVYYVMRRLRRCGADRAGRIGRIAERISAGQAVPERQEET